jgi:predicted O-linked N-acetylglucosamine transferase (SPINDLY family)
MALQQDLESAIALHQAGRLAEAETAYAAILARYPDHPAALLLLGMLRDQSGRAREGVELIERAVRLNPKLPTAHTNLGNALAHAGRAEEGIAAHRAAVGLDPDDAGAHFNLGVALANAGRIEEAISIFQRAAQLKPDYFEALAALADALSGKGRFAEEIGVYREIIRLRPDLAIAHNNLGNALKAAGRVQEGMEELAEAIRLKPDYAEAYYNLGKLHKEEYRLDEAARQFRQAIALKPELAEAHSALGGVLQDTGRVESGLASFRRAAELRPETPELQSNVLLSLNLHPDAKPEEVFAEHRAWSDQHAGRLVGERRPHLNKRTQDRKLRIGYISADFWGHSVGQFALPLLQNHDRQEFEVFCYSNSAHSDEMTTRIRHSSNVWHNILGMPDDAVAELIRRDAIDILVDLSGHTAGHRLLVMARKPAPVQVTYLGYPNTTGMECIDYRFTDNFADPPGMTEHLNAEKLWRLPTCAWCYRAPENSPEPKRRLSGPITLGCFNTFGKVNGWLISLWAELLKATPESRLVLKSVGAGEASSKERVRAQFRDLGIDPERIEMIGRIADARGHLEYYNRIDIALDTYPYNGTATTCEALWMGVPVVMLAGKTHVSRVGVSLLSNVGLGDLIAGTREEYISIARGLAENPGRLRKLRESLRGRMRSSPLMDGARFAGEVESAYRQMWKTWCENAPARPDLAALEEQFQAAVALENAGKLEDAEKAYREVLATDGNLAVVHNNLGNTLQAMARLTEAVAEFREAVRLKPELAEAQSNLGNALCALGQCGEAISFHREAIRLKPTLAEAHLNLGLALGGDGRYEEAIAAKREAIRLKPDYAEAHCSLGNVLGYIGEFEEAIACHRRAIELKMDSAALSSNLLFELNYQPDGDAAAMFREHLAWGEKYGTRRGKTIRHTNERSPDRRLRVGYVSADFGRHSVAYFLNPLLEHHDRKAVDVFCYSNVKAPDDFTDRIRRLSDGWRNIVGASDDALAQIVREDRIDILVDLSGHTSGHRLLAFAEKPAPVQVTYLGYANTTGMRVIDYRLTDSVADPLGMTDALNAEKLWRLPRCAWCFEPGEGAPDIRPRPGGAITFGCFNAFAKINPRLTRLWAELLKRLPGSRLLLKSSGAGAASAQKRIIGQFVQQGVSADRIEMLGRTADARKHLEAYNRVDVALDTYPYHGTATTCEALWMGAPVVTLAGKTHVSRVGASLLTNVGLPDLVANEPEEYISIAERLAKSPTRLADLRKGLRDQMRTSPLMDASRFARGVESAYREMWRIWCATGT